MMQNFLRTVSTRTTLVSILFSSPSFWKDSYSPEHPSGVCLIGMVNGAIEFIQLTKRIQEEQTTLLTRSVYLNINGGTFRSCSLISLRQICSGMAKNVRNMRKIEKITEMDSYNWGLQKDLPMFGLPPTEGGRTSRESCKKIICRKKLKPSINMAVSVLYTKKDRAFKTMEENPGRASVYQ